MSTVNLSEVCAKLQVDGWDEQEACEVVESFGLDVIPVDWEIAMLAAAMRVPTKHLGLGLGDRICLATSKRLNAPVLTADQAWSKLGIEGLEVSVIR